MHHKASAPNLASKCLKIDSALEIKAIGAKKTI
jgi:hypothetical protein